MAPPLSCLKEQHMALPAIEPAKGFVKYNQTSSLTKHSTPQPYSLALSTGHKTTAFAQHSLQSVGEMFQHLPEAGGIKCLRK